MQDFHNISTKQQVTLDNTGTNRRMKEQTKNEKNLQWTSQDSCHLVTSRLVSSLHVGRKLHKVRPALSSLACTRNFSVFSGQYCDSGGLSLYDFPAAQCICVVESH
ncbi:hypothetical protein AVEN_30040-1 [Araneus ventricosus]|uniref:Uncharacterized protein n=1 Tax=Araneus ventricosus TaxID=182803 RepID=A0A4Y2I7A8_ARAVE|nr:hypothetical protein AVEN_30040-1 [Araneus ventricosus]